VATHKWSLCGYYGGDYYEQIEIKVGERRVFSIPRPEYGSKEAGQ
jgi:hypothetical protein